MQKSNFIAVMYGICKQNVRFCVLILSFNFTAVNKVNSGRVSLVFTEKSIGRVINILNNLFRLRFYTMINCQDYYSLLTRKY